MRVGVLALQGAFLEHCRSLRACGADPVEIRKPEQLEGCRALVIPGGESTTMGRLMTAYDLLTPIREMAAAGTPIFGTCAGMVMLARQVEGLDQTLLGLMNITVKRNGFGRQVDSFEADLQIPVLGKEPLRGVFIRAPYITALGEGVEVLAVYHDKIVLVRQGKLLAASFHPELTDDLRLHKYFLEFVA